MKTNDIYTRPNLYDEALPSYIFAGKPDEDLLRTKLETLFKAADGTRALELGCGTGRMTEVIREFVDELTCVDSSPEMLRAFRARIPGVEPILANARKFVEAASLARPRSTYDFIVACWSLNYPLLECFEFNNGMQIIHRSLGEGRAKAHQFLDQLIGSLAPEGTFMTFFFDPDCAEQSVVTELWEQFAPFPGSGRDYTRRLLREYLMSCEGETQVQHYTGHSLARDFEQARTWYLAGHLKGFPPLTEQRGVRGAVDTFLQQYLESDGTVRVPSGLYVLSYSKSSC